MRKIGNVLLSVFLSAICRARVTDPTSGFWCVRDDLLRYFSFCYPCEYPEPEALALLRRQGYAMAEADVTVRPRRHGVSTIGSIDTLYFALRVARARRGRVRPAIGDSPTPAAGRRLKHAGILPVELGRVALAPRRALAAGSRATRSATLRARPRRFLLAAAAAAMLSWPCRRTFAGPSGSRMGRIRLAFAGPASSSSW